jgi:aldose 1-epimerase
MRGAMLPRMFVRLKRDSLEAILAPAIGGGIAAFRADGRAIFRCDAQRAADARALGEFPMGPYANRIARGTFRWRNEQVSLPRNFGDHPHPLHGVGWRRPWTCRVESECCAVMELASGSDADWPWRTTMTRAVSLTDGALEIAFALRNDDARPMPASIGLHPHFPAAGAVLRLAAQTQLMTTPDGVPRDARRTDAVAQLAAGAPACVLALDHCLEGWDGMAEIAWPTHSVRIGTSPPQAFVQVYAPAGADFFCVEPMSAPPDAVNRGAAAELAPGETLAFTTRFAPG